MPKHSRFNNKPVMTTCVEMLGSPSFTSSSLGIFYSQSRSLSLTLRAGGFGGPVGSQACTYALHPGSQQGSQAFAGFLCQIPKLVAGVLLICSGTQLPAPPPHDHLHLQNSAFSPRFEVRFIHLSMTPRCDLTYPSFPASRPTCPPSYRMGCCCPFVSSRKPKETKPLWSILT